MIFKIIYTLEYIIESVTDNLGYPQDNSIVNRSINGPKFKNVVVDKTTWARMTKNRHIRNRIICGLIYLQHDPFKIPRARYHLAGI